MTDATPAPDPAPVPPIVNPTPETLLAAHGTLTLGAFGRFWTPDGAHSVSTSLVLAAIAGGTAFVAQVGPHNRPFAVTATQPDHVVTPESVGTSAAATQEVGL